MTVIYQRPPIVDGLVVTTPLSSTATLQAVRTQLFKMLKAKKQIFPSGDIRLTPKSHGVHIHLYPEHDRKIAELQVAMTEGGQKYFRLGLWPSQFHDMEFPGLQELIADWLSPLTYQSLFMTGNVTRLDIAIDDLLHPAHSFLPFRPKSNSSGIYQNWCLQKGGTYLGSKFSKLQFCIYDKARQLLETGQDVLFGTHTRIEARLRHLGCSPAQVLANVANVFEVLEILNLLKARQASTNVAWQDFLTTSQHFGTARALSNLSTKYLRSQYIARLREAPEPWWKPTKDWQAFAPAFDKLQPTV